MRDVYVGTYADRGGAGLHRLQQGRIPGDAYAAVRNTSYAVWSPRHDLHYLVDEREEGALGVFRETATGWRQLARVSTAGAAPCHVTLDADRNRLAVANYASGSIALFHLDEATGLPAGPPFVRGNASCGPVRDRQEGPHAHCVRFSPDGRWLYHVDLGTDQVRAHMLDPSTGWAGGASVAFQAPAGSGPRRLVWHPSRPLALLLCELSSILIVLAVADGRLSPMQMVSTLPPGFTGKSLAGHVSVDAAGRRVHVTNRGHDSVATFGWDANGRLRLLQHVPSGGASPRAFILLEDEGQLLLANEQGGNVTAFALRSDGTLSPHHADIAIPGAAFLFSSRQRG